jgi:hypothetical protein
MGTQIKIHAALYVLPATLITFYHLLYKKYQKNNRVILQPPSSVVKSIV